jgi:hypothetical protein
MQLYPGSQVRPVPQAVFAAVVLQDDRPQTPSKQYAALGESDTVPSLGLFAHQLSFEHAPPIGSGLMQTGGDPRQSKPAAQAWVMVQEEPSPTGLVHLPARLETIPEKRGRAI